MHTGRPSHRSLGQRLIAIVMIFTMAIAPALHGSGRCHPAMGTDASAMADMSGHAHHAADTSSDAAPAAVPELPPDCCGVPVVLLTLAPAAVHAMVSPAPVSAPTTSCADVRPAAHPAAQPPATGPPVLLRSA